MIFGTVGTQLPFPRLMQALDELAGRRKIEIVAQTNEPTGRYKNLREFTHLQPSGFDECMEKARLVVGHAGIGTILGARRFGKPLVLFPRVASRGEHRNEHQLATVAALAGREGIYVAENAAALEKFLADDELKALSAATGPARQQLIDHLREFIDSV